MPDREATLRFIVFDALLARVDTQPPNVEAAVEAVVTALLSEPYRWIWEARDED